MKPTTIKKLKEIIKDLPDDTRVVTPGSDHSYNDIFFIFHGTALASSNSEDLYEDHGDENKCDDRDVRIKVLVIE